jgi:hypothetical protein
MASDGASGAAVIMQWKGFPTDIQRTTSRIRSCPGREISRIVHRQIHQEEIAGTTDVLTSKPWNWSRRSECRAAELKARQKYRESAPIGDFQYVLAVHECIAKSVTISRDEAFSGLSAVGLENREMIGYPANISRTGMEIANAKQRLQRLRPQSSLGRPRCRRLGAATWIKDKSAFQAVRAELIAGEQQTSSVSVR